MRILISGHKGFVGRNFIEFLAKQVGVDEIVGIDLKDGHDCRDFFKRDNSYFDLVIHLAAIVGGRLTIEGNPLSVATDLSIDAEMFNWALRTKPGKIVYFSSSAAYPIEAQEKPHDGLRESQINLDHIKNPDMTYGWAKLTGEYLAKFAREAGLKVYVFRPFSGYGSDQDLDYPFPSFIKRAAEKTNPFEIWGDGTQTRDFIHIDDIVAAVWTVIHKTMLQSEIPEAINLCTGRETSFRELANLCCEAASSYPDKLYLLDKPVGVKYRHGDPSLMTNYYIPRVTLEEGIRRALHENYGI